MILPLSSFALLACLFLVSLACYTLRDLSLSELSAACETRNVPDRMNIIRDRRDEAMIALDALAVLLLIAVTACVLLWQTPWNPPAGSWWPSMAFWIRIGGLAVLTLFAAQLLPWSLSRVVGEAYLVRIWPLVSGLVTVGIPWVSLANRFDTITHRITGKTPPDEDEEETHVTSELKTYVSERLIEGSLDSGAGYMINSIMNLGQKDVAAIMTPRTEIMFVQADATPEEARRIFLQGGHSRMPVVEDSPDTILGMLHAKDLLEELKSASDADLLNAAEANGEALLEPDVLSEPETNGNDEPPTIRGRELRSPYYVPETMPVDMLLGAMRENHTHMAVVLDEYGGVCGLVTMEDILEEIVGEIADEHDPETEEDPVREVSPGVAEVDARLNLSDANDRLGLDLPDGDYDTIAGFVISQLGELPQTGSELAWNGHLIRVVSADERRIELLSVETNSELERTPVD